MKLDFQLGNFIVHPTVQVVSLYWNHHAFGVFLLRRSAFSCFEKWLPLNCVPRWFLITEWPAQPRLPPALTRTRCPAQRGRKGLHLRHISDYLSCQWLIHVMALKSSYKITINYSFNRDQSCIKMGLLSTRMLRYPGAFSLSLFCVPRKKERLNG